MPDEMSERHRGGPIAHIACSMTNDSTERMPMAVRHTGKARQARDARCWCGAPIMVYCTKQIFFPHILGPCNN